MAGFNFGGLTAALAETKGSGVSFESQAKKWETEENAKDLIEAINNCKNLQYLNLEGNTLGVEAARGIGEALKKHPEFKEALFKDLFTGRLKTEIPQALEAMGRGMSAAGAHLTVLDCSDNALGPNGMVGLVELLKSPTCFSLQELKLNNCGLGIGGGKMLAQALTDCHEASLDARTPLQLKVFIAGRNRLENDGAKALGAVFERIQTLEHVAMPQNGIYYPGIIGLSDGFKVNPNMKILNLNDNTIGPKGAEAIADALVSMQQLHEINFGDCLLKTRGAVILGEALQDSHLGLEILNLGFNEIGPNGGYAIVAAMDNKEQLQSLNLNGNQFGEEAREGIRELLEESNRLNALEELDEDDSDAEDDDDEDAVTSEIGSGEETDSETEGVNDNYETLNLNSTTDANNSALNWTLSSQSITQDESRLEFLQENTAAGFCNQAKPTAQQFADLQSEANIDAFRKYLQNIPENDYLWHAVYATLKVGSIASKQQDALLIACDLLKDCYDHAVKTNQVFRVNNFFLAQLGLLKIEDKKFEPAYNAESLRYVFNHAISQPGTVPNDVSNMYQLFLKQFPIKN